MKILHISTFELAGAGIAAKRIHLGMLEQGFDSNLLLLHGREDLDNRIYVYKKGKVKLINKIDVLIRKYILRDKFKTIKQLYKDKIDYFSNPITNYRIENIEIVKSADIINLHWVADFINYSTFFKKIKKPIFWTLHDMNVLLGGIHYSIDNIGDDIFQKTEKDLFVYKKKILQENQRIHFIVLCNWMLNQLSNSYLGTNESRKIYNGIDINSFRPISKNSAKEIFNLDPECYYVLFVSERLNSKRKGIQLIYEIRKKVKEKNIIFLALGKKEEVESLNINITYLPLIKENLLLNALYNAVDIVLITSLQDNLPNIMLESLMTGTPVISFNLGGMSEIISNGFNGEVVEPFNTEIYAQKISYLIQNKNQYDQKAISNDARNKFDVTQQIKKYYNYYNDTVLLFESNKGLSRTE